MHDHIDQRIVIGIGNYPIYCAHRQSAREYLIASAGDDGIACFDSAVGRNIDHLKLTVGAALQNAAGTRGFEKNTYTAGRVGNEQHLTGVRKYVLKLADNAIRRNDRHVLLQTVCRSFVDV